jgi:hypothetical protein
MEVRFNWNPLPPREQKEAIEAEILDLLQHSDIRPCHEGEVSVVLGARGALRTRIAGQVLCRCGESLASVGGDADTANVTLTDTRAARQERRTGGTS